MQPLGAKPGRIRPLNRMARPLRPLVAGGIYHVTARGNGRSDIYTDDEDRATFCRVLDRTTERFDWRCLTYCLMGNHFHLLVQTPQPNLPRGMQSLKSGYAQQYNRRHDRDGHLFAGRYHAVLVQQDAHLLEVFRYLALNPVRAGLCRNPNEWTWSGHAALAGEATAPAWHAVEAAHSYFTEEADAGVDAYTRFVCGDGAGRYPTRGVVFGDDEFKRAVLPRGRPDTEVPRRDWTEGRPSLDDILGGTRDAADVSRAYRFHGYSMPEIASYLGCHVATVSRLLRAAEHEAATRKGWPLCGNARSDP